MGLFYSALERADQGKPETTPAADRPPSEAGPSRVTTWEEAERRDLAGFPLEASPIHLAPTRSEAPRTVQLRIATMEEGLAKEQYRILRARILEALRPLPQRSLLITSAAPGEGKTLVAANLALQFASLREGRVLLMDADLRRAGLSDTLLPAPRTGLGQYLRGEVEFEDTLHMVDPWLTVLPTLRQHEQGAELLASQRMVELMAQACSRFDLVLLDGAPVGPVADSRMLARLAGASLLVVRAATTPTDEIEAAAALLRPGLLGSVLNAATVRRRGKYGYYPYGAADAVEKPVAP